MINYKLIIKPKSINIYDYAIMKFNHERLIKEFMIIVHNILMILRFDIPFRKI